MADRLRRARQAAGYSRAVEAIRAFGWNKSTYYGHENARRGIARDQIVVYATAFHVARDWLASGQGAMRGTGPLRIRIEGHVGNLAIQEDNFQQEHAVDEVELPPINLENYASHRVHGNDYYPEWRDRDVIFTLRNHGPPENYLGQRCLIKLRDRAELIIRTVMAGTRAGVFVLLAQSMPPMIDIEILEAAPIILTLHG
jgi:hypothetical protein